MYVLIAILFGLTVYNINLNLQVINKINEPKHETKPIIVINETKVSENNDFIANPAPPITTKYYSAEEVDLLAKIVWVEARGEGDEGQQAVVEVILNRVKSDKFPNTINNVIFAKGQFTSAKYVSTAKPTEREYENVKLVLSERVDVFPDDVVFFSTLHINGKYFKTIGNHCFSTIG